MNGKVRPLLTSVGARLGVVALFCGSLGACSKKAEEKPAGLDPLPGATAPSQPAAPAPPSAAAPAMHPAMPEQAPAEPAAPSGPPIEGTLELPAARKKDVAPTDVIFLVARTMPDAPGVRGSLVAVKRFTAEKFPIPFKLGPEDMMFRGGGTFSGELTLAARVDKDGDPMSRKKGDVFGTVDHVKVGAKGVKVVLAEVQKEDESLLGSTTMPPSGGNPHGPGGPGVPGLPPGHP